VEADNYLFEDGQAATAEAEAEAEIKDWLLSEVATGLQRLVALSLPGHPPAETIVLTAVVWRDALRRKFGQWDMELDTPRIRAAFASLEDSAEEWPVPVRLLRALPSRPEPLMLPPAQLTEEQKKDNLHWVQKLKQQVLSVGTKWAMPKPKPEDYED
jgi:hypothetical protein